MKMRNNSKTKHVPCRESSSKNNNDNSNNNGLKMGSMTDWKRKNFD